MDAKADARSEMGRALAALRRRVTAQSAVCSAEITGAAHRRYCSDACRVHAYRERKRAKATIDERKE